MVASDIQEEDEEEKGEDEEEEGEEDWCSESRILNNTRPPPVQLLHNAKVIFVCLTFRGSLKRYPHFGKDRPPRW